MGYGYRVADGAETVMGFPYENLPLFSDYEDEWEAQIDYREAWQDFIQDALSCLGKTWRPVADGPWRNGHPGGLVIAKSGLHQLLIEEDRGGYGYAYLSILPRDDLEPGWENLAAAVLKKCGCAAFDRLAEIRELRIPGGYVSAPYQPKSAA